MKQIVIATLVVALFGSFQSFAADTSKAPAYKQTLASVTAAELPAKAADLVKAAKTTDLQHVTVDVVKAAIDLNSAAAPSIVGAVAHAVPAMAPVAAGRAAALQPKQAAAIAKSAAAAAPKMAGKIVVAVCQAVPNDYRNIAIAVSQAAPGSGKEILAAVGSAIPELKAPIDKVLNGYQGEVASVQNVLDAVKTTQTDTPAPRGPSTGPPYLPPPPTPINVPPSGSGNVPPGGRDYAAP